MRRPLVLDHCVIAVSDWARSNAFYEQVLGAEVEQRDELSGRYRFGDWKLNVHGPAFTGLNARKPVEPGNSDLCFVWDGRSRTRSSIYGGAESPSKQVRWSWTAAPAAPGATSTSATPTAACSSSSRTPS